MSVFLPSDVLGQFATNVELVTNASGPAGAFTRSAYRFTLDKEPDSAPHGLYFLDMPSVGPRETRWGDGSNITNSAVTVRLLYNRPGGALHDGDRQGVLRNAASDCIKLGDVCENPSNYGSSTSGIRVVIFQGASRVQDKPLGEIWEAKFSCQWQSDMDTTTVVDLTQRNVVVASIAALEAYAVNSLASGCKAFVTDAAVWSSFTLKLGDTQQADGVQIVATLPVGAGNWLRDWYGTGDTLISTVA